MNDYLADIYLDTYVRYRVSVKAENKEEAIRKFKELDYDECIDDEVINDGTVDEVDIFQCWNEDGDEIDI